MESEKIEYKAFESFTIVDQQKATIECIAQWGKDKLFAGTKDGILMVFKIEREGNNRIF